MAWWYSRADEDFLRMPFKNFFRLLRNMERNQAKQKLDAITTAMTAQSGKQAKKVIESLQAQIYGKRKIQEAKRQDQRARNVVAAFFNILQNRKTVKR